MGSFIKCRLAMNKESEKLTGKYLQMKDGPRKGLWVGTIQDGQQIVDIGMELTKEKIIKWLKLSMDLKLWLIGESVPDMYDLGDGDTTK